MRAHGQERLSKAPREAGCCNVGRTHTHTHTAESRTQGDHVLDFCSFSNTPLIC